jgi:hypothetical protein
MTRSKLRFAILLILLFSSLLLLLTLQVSAGTPIEVGWIDHSFGSVVTNPAAEKPQSKLWYNAGFWWGALYQPSASAYTIQRFDWASDTWTNTGVVIDAREDSNIDILWDGSKLYTLSHGTTVGLLEDSAELRRYSYNSGSQTYSLDGGFPVTVSTGGMEAAVIAKDSTGTLWITFTQNSGFVYVSHSSGADTTWVTPYFLPFGSPADGQADDISSIIAFGGNKIGVMWSNQNTDAFYFAVHQDGAADNIWTLETALQGSYIADDHISLKTDSTGKLYAAVKTSVGDNPSAAPSESLIRLLVRQTNGSWSWYNFGRVSELHTRPLVLLDEETRSIYMFATLPTGSDTQGEIRFKKTSMDSIAFPEGLGAQIIYSSSHRYINNVSSSKQNITCASGVLVIADDNGKNFYFHNKGPCGLGVVVPPAPTPTPTTTATVTPSAPSQRIKDITFEDGSLTHLVTGADSVSGTMLLESSNPLKGSYSVRMAPLADNPFLEEEFTAANDFYLSFYIKLDSYPTSDVRLVLISNAGTTVGNIQLRPSGRLRLRNVSTTIGAESTVLALGQLYRIGIQQTRGSGTNAVLRAYLSPNDDAFGSPFAQSTIGTWTTGADRLRLGATTAGTFNLVLDDIRLDTAAMPAASNPPNQAPTISDVSDQTIAANSATSALAFTIGDLETPAENLVMTAVSSNPSLVPVDNIVFAGLGAERSVIISPASNQIGSATITLTVSDAVLSSSDSFVITVTNSAPTISNMTDQTTSMNASTSVIAFTIGDAETAADNLILSASSSDQSLLPDANIVFAGSGVDRTVTVIPASNQAGTATITLSVSDSIASSSDSFVLTVTNNAPTISDLTDQSIPANTATSAISFTIGDAETAVDNLVLSASSSGQSLVPDANIVFAGSGAERTVTITPANNQVGTATITLNVSDGIASSSDSFVLTVTNAVPTISDVSDQSIPANTSTSALAFTIGDAETAVDNLVLSASSSNPSLVPDANIVFAGSGVDRTVTVTPTSNQAGTATITLSVSDGIASTSDTFVLTVTNAVPTISDVSDQSIPTNSAISALAFTIGDAETAAEALVLSASSSNPSLVPDANIIFAGSGAERTVTVTPASNQAGTATIMLSVSDGISSTSDTFVLTVTNAAPTISDVSDQSIPANTSTTAIAFTIGDAETAVDSLVLSAASSNPNLVPVANIVFAGSGANRSVTISPTSNQAGTSTIGISVSDGLASTMDTFILTVTNTPPTISDVSDQTIFVNSATSTLAFTIGDTETAAESLVLNANSSDTLLVPNTNIVLGGSGANRSVTVSPAPNQAGSATITLTVSDGFAESSDTFVLTVNPQAGTTVLNFLPTDDAHVRSDKVTTNYGSLDHLRIRGTAAFYTSYLKFNLTAVNGPITSAILRVYATDGTSNPSSVYAVSNTYFGSSSPWLQTGINWNNAPAMSGSPIATRTASIANNSWIEYDVSSAVTGNGSYSFGLSTAGSNSLYFNSLEASSNKPVLEISYADSGNTAPTISDVTDQTISVNSATSALAFTISDAQTAAGSLLLSASSSNINLVPNANIVFGGSGTNRTVTVSPAPNQVGTAIISLNVSDGILSASDSFVLTVNVGAGTTTLSFLPTDDALVRSDRATTNYGTLDYLRLRGTEAFYTSYMKFNLTGLNGTITSARLRLYATDGTSNPSSVYAVSNNYLGTSTSWTQLGLNWNNAPLMSGSPAATTQSSIGNNSWIEYDLSSVITGEGSYSFGLSVAGSNSLYFNSKEAISNQPVLEITINSGGSGNSSMQLDRPEINADASIVLPQPTVTVTEQLVPTEIVPSETVPPESTSTPIPSIEPTAIPTEEILVPSETATEVPTEVPSEVPNEERTEVGT